MSDARPTPVPFDPELVPGLEAFLAEVEAVPLAPDTILVNRSNFAATVLPPAEQVGDAPVEWREVEIPRADGSILEGVVVGPRGGASGAPGVLGIHGGGMILGTRHYGIDFLIDSAVRYGTVGLSVEYRLAPENPFPAGVEDCYTGLVWLAENAADLGVDPGRILVSGFSAGGGLAAAVSLMARDRGGPAIAAQYLGAPMIDDRNETVSSRQYDGIGAWSRSNNETAWAALLGVSAGQDGVSPYAAPARTDDFSGLPPALIEVGAAEVFRDEAVAYASGIWAVGGQAELHVWAGTHHVYRDTAPDAHVTRASNDVRWNWVERVLGVTSS